MTAIISKMMGKSLAVSRMRFKKGMRGSRGGTLEGLSADQIARYPMNRIMSMMPGKIPAINKRVMETSAATPYTIMMMDGGIKKPSVEEPAKLPIVVFSS